MKIGGVFLFAVLLTLSFSRGYGQELNCKVGIYHEKIQGNHDALFEHMKSSITQVLNSQKWSRHTYDTKSQIECNFLFNITSKNGDMYKAELQVQASRPVFNSNYSTTLLNYKDVNIAFIFEEFTPLYYNESGVQNSLVSILAYYAHMIIGLHQDSFSPLAGSASFEQADRIANGAQSMGYMGWESSDIRGKFWFPQELLHEHFLPLRRFNYIYHRLGLDLMADDVEQGRKHIVEGLQALELVEENRPGSVLMQLWFDAKSSEMVSIFSESTAQEKEYAGFMMKKLDPARTTKYSFITE